MRYSATAGRWQRGFTLVEVLVIVVIVSIVVSVTLLSMSVLGEDTEMDKEAQRLEQLIASVREQAGMQGRDFGLRFHIGGYEFLRYDVRRDLWYPPENDPLLRARELPEGLLQRVYVDGRELALEPQSPPIENKDRVEPSDKPPPPQIFILSNGDLTGFELVLEREGTNRMLTLLGTADGSLEIKAGDDEEKA